MLKPLSEKTLQKKYAELGLPETKVDLLHRYFRCFANLYGVISVREAWDVFRHYEGVGYVRKKDFASFSGIAQREVQPYKILELKEVYHGETSEDPLDRLIIHDSLITSGSYRFMRVYDVQESQGDKSLYVPEKEAFFRYEEDQFYMTEYGLKMKKMVEKLKTTGIERDFNGRIYGEIKDLSGDSVAGKRLSEFQFYDFDERLDIKYLKSESRKEYLRELYAQTASEKILQKIENCVMIGIFQSPARDLEYLFKYLNQKAGVELSEKQIEEFVQLYMMLNNTSHIWQNCGWSPTELAAAGRPMVPKISFGPGMQKMFANGEMDRDEIVRELKKLNLDVE